MAVVPSPTETPALHQRLRHPIACHHRSSTVYGCKSSSLLLLDGTTTSAAAAAVSGDMQSSQPTNKNMTPRNAAVRVGRVVVDIRWMVLFFLSIASMTLLNKQSTRLHRQDAMVWISDRSLTNPTTTMQHDRSWQDQWYEDEDQQTEFTDGTDQVFTDGTDDQHGPPGFYTMDDDQLWRTSKEEINDEFDSIAACLMFKDDLRNLREWIPYHYHVANLRYLILRLDPNSRDNPTDVLNKWSDKMQIEIWYNDTFITDKDWDDWRNATQHIIRKDAPLGQAELVLTHSIFINKCLRRLKQRGVGWTLNIDPDEYIRINSRSIASWNENHPTDEPYEFSKQPPMSESGAVMNFLRSEFQRDDRLKDIFDEKCIQIPRSRFGAAESKPYERNRAFPSSLSSSTNNKLDALHFDTLRFRYHSLPESEVEGNQMSKTMVNLRKIPKYALRRKGNMHIPVLAICSARKRLTQQSDHVLIVNHYLGSEDQFLYRSDQRRTPDFFSKQAKISDMNDDAIQPWLAGFVREHGEEMAKHLLQ